MREPSPVPRPWALTTGETSHDRLVGFMWWSGGALVVCGIVVAVLMARGDFWLVDRTLVRHERFISDAAHELRGPVSALRAVAEAGLAGDEPPERALRRAVRIAQRTDQVIDDLMTLARMETGRKGLQGESVRLDLLVEAMVAQRRRASLQRPAEPRRRFGAGDRRLGRSHPR